MKYSETELTPEEIKTAKQEDEEAYSDYRMLFIYYKYWFEFNLFPPKPEHLDPRRIIGEGWGVEHAYWLIKQPSESYYIMHHGGYYAVMKECIARRTPWQVLLNAEPYLAELEEEKEKKSGYRVDIPLVHVDTIYSRFSDYFDLEELLNGFSWEELWEDDKPVEPMELFKFSEADLLKNHPEHYDEYKKYCERKQVEWEEQCLPRLKAKHSAKDAVYHAAKKFFLENDELPPKPAKEPAQHG